MASYSNTVRIQEHVISIDNLYEDVAETDFLPYELEHDEQLPPKEVCHKIPKFHFYRVSKMLRCL